MLFDTGCDGKNVRVKDDVFRRKTHSFGQDLVSTAANLKFALAGIRLANFIEGHHHHGGTVAAHQLGVLDKGFFALFHRDRVDDAFTLNAFQALFDNAPFRGVDHDRDAGYVRLTGDQAEETHHRRFGVEHPFIHVDVDDLGTALHLLAGHGQRLVILFFFNQPLETGRAGNVSTLTHVDEQRFGINIQRFQAGQAASHR
ncbi:hypothetical protein D3C79_682260 [compost metagenome]